MVLIRKSSFVRTLLWSLYDLLRAFNFSGRTHNAQHGRSQQCRTACSTPFHSRVYFTWSGGCRGGALRRGRIGDVRLTTWAVIHYEFWWQALHFVNLKSSLSGGGGGGWLFGLPSYAQVARA